MAGDGAHECGIADIVQLLDSRYVARRAAESTGVKPGQIYQ
jgi:hypothetical protein